MTAERPAAKRWLLRLAKLLIVALVLWGVHGTLKAQLEKLTQLEQSIWHFDFFWLTIAGLLYLLGNAPSAVFWHNLLWAMDQRPSLASSLRAYYIGHLGKYVPGKAVVIVLRAGLLRSQQVDPVAATVTVFYETLTTMAVGAFVAAGILAVLFHEDWDWMLVAIGLMIGSGLPTYPPISWRLAKWLGVGRANPRITEHLADLDGRTIAWGWFIIAVGWVIMGLSLWAVLKAIGPQADAQLAELPRYTASNALSIVAGFVSFVPGGLLVRELVLMDLLAVGTSKEVGATPLVAAIMFRVAAVVAELVICGILYFLPGKPTASTPAEK